MKHTTIYHDKSRIMADLPLIPELQEYHPGGSFPLIVDPKKTNETSIIGMFVLRPAKKGVAEAITCEDDIKNLYKADGWAFNVRGHDGGALIANGNSVDAYRLALQYGLADAVMMGSTTVAVEGVDYDGRKGYVWHAENPASWGQISKHDTQLLGKISKNRRLWQDLGYLSSRKYPAQIVITQSGKPGKPNDILAARIFHARDPEGNPIEAYILTSEQGAERIRARAEEFGLEDRIEKILIPLSPQDNLGLIDLARVPKVLYREYDIRIANHDGGRMVLSEFLKAGIMPQVNLTLSRNKSILDILHEQEEHETIKDFDDRVSYFFSEGRLPEKLRPASVIVDKGDVAVVAFDARGLKGEGL